jgi:ribosome-binding factor A
MMKEVALILRDVKDPRVSDNFVSITAVDVTPDLKYAKIFYSALSGDTKEISKGLSSCTGYVRRRLAQSLNLRITPELTFVIDTSISHGAHIASLLEKIEFSDDIDRQEDDEQEEDDDDK